jgi:hypothetical protein
VPKRRPRKYQMSEIEPGKHITADVIRGIAADSPEEIRDEILAMADTLAIPTGRPIPKGRLELARRLGWLCSQTPVPDVARGFDPSHRHQRSSPGSTSTWSGMTRGHVEAARP